MSQDRTDVPPVPVRPTRRRVLRGGAAAGVLAATGGALPGCTADEADAAAQPVPAYYPAAYDKLVDASRRER
ncbi:twin-arginine translocation signal domain-containing protein [Streptomyces sp. NPDC021098]|uniref:twin-arginine translocation signal domain-containing protein n=1 Tax=unclassified Streptomyces TaxID=2593676 RepID=UPI0037A19201